MRANITIN